MIEKEEKPSQYHIGTGDFLSIESLDEIFEHSYVRVPKSGSRVEEKKLI